MSEIGSEDQNDLVFAIVSKASQLREELGADAVRAVLELHLSRGADVNHFQRNIWKTPLCVAVEQDDLDMVSFLLQHGADPLGGSPAMPAQAPLFFALRFKRKEALELMLAVNPDLLKTPHPTRANQGADLFDYAVDHNEDEDPRSPFCKWIRDLVHPGWRERRDARRRALREARLKNPEEAKLKSERFRENLRWERERHREIYAMSAHFLPSKLRIKFNRVNGIGKYYGCTLSIKEASVDIRVDTKYYGGDIVTATYRALLDGDFDAQLQSIGAWAPDRKGHKVMGDFDRIKIRHDLCDRRCLFDLGDEKYYHS